MTVSKDKYKAGKITRNCVSKPFHVLSKAETVFHETSNGGNGKFYVIIYANYLLLSRGQEN